MIDDRSEEAAGAAGRVEHALTFFQVGIDPVDHEGGDGARSVKLAGVAGATQIVEHLLVDVAQAGAGLEIVEVDRLFQLFDHRQHLRAGFHEVVGIFKNLLNDLVRGALAGVNLLFQGWKELVVDEANQLTAGDLRFLFPFGVNQVFGPVAPAEALGQRGFVRLALILGIVFPFFFALVENLEEQHPGELAQALGVAINAVVLAHDVLDRFDGTAEIHYVVLLLYPPSPKA
jgi:hypothetical protein